MVDRHTEVTRSGWGKRIGQSLSGALIGGLLFLASFALLWWNEGRAIAEARALEEGAGAVIDVGIDAFGGWGLDLNRQRGGLDDA